MNDLTFADFLLSFLITWTIVLLPPTAIRLIRHKPLTKWVAIGMASALYFSNLILFVALGSQSKSHSALIIGAILSYHVLRWQTKAGATKDAAVRRKEPGYDE